LYCVYIGKTQKVQLWEAEAGAGRQLGLQPVQEAGGALDPKSYPVTHQAFYLKGPRRTMARMRAGFSHIGAGRGCWPEPCACRQVEGRRHRKDAKVEYLASEVADVLGHPSLRVSAAASEHQTTGLCTARTAQQTSRKRWVQRGRNQRGLVHGPAKARLLGSAAWRRCVRIAHEFLPWSISSTFRDLGCVAEGVCKPLQQGGGDFDGLCARVGHG